MYARVKLVESTGRVLAFNLACFAIRSRIVELFILNSWSFREPYYLRFMISSCTGCWFGTMEFYDFPIILGIIIPTNFIIFQRGRSTTQPDPTSGFRHVSFSNIGRCPLGSGSSPETGAVGRFDRKEAVPGKGSWELFHGLKVAMEQHLGHLGLGIPTFLADATSLDTLQAQIWTNFCMIEIMCLQWFCLKQWSLDGAVWGWRSSQMANFWELLWRKYVRHVALKAFHILQFSWIRGHCRNWLVNMFYFSIYWECHHPNWRTPSFFRAVGQPPTRYLYME